MTTTDLLAIIEPHATMLGELGCSVIREPMSSGEVGIALGRDLRWYLPEAAALILEAVARRAMDEWQCVGPDEPHREYLMEPRLDGDTFGIASNGDNHSMEREPSSLAVALQLLAWCRGVGA